MDELVEILTEDGKYTGEKISKAIAHKEGICHGISVIALIDNQGRLLIQKRAEKKKDEPNKWDVSGAGHIDPGEKPDQAARRELFEELGIDVEEKDMQLIDTYLNQNILANDVFLNHYTYLFVARKNINIDNIAPEKSEVSDFMFVDKKKYLELQENGELVLATKHCSKILNYMK